MMVSATLFATAAWVASAPLFLMINRRFTNSILSFFIVLLALIVGNKVTEYFKHPVMLPAIEDLTTFFLAERSDYYIVSALMFCFIIKLIRCSLIYGPLRFFLAISDIVVAKKGHASNWFTKPRSEWVLSLSVAIAALTQVVIAYRSEPNSFRSLVYDKEMTGLLDVANKALVVCSRMKEDIDAIALRNTPNPLASAVAQEQLSNAVIAQSMFVPDALGKVLYSFNASMERSLDYVKHISQIQSTSTFDKDLPSSCRQLVQNFAIDIRYLGGIEGMGQTLYGRFASPDVPGSSE